MPTEDIYKTVYVAFGDASTGEAGTFYGFCLLPEDALASSICAVNNIKKQYGGTELSRIHCRELFNEIPRKKSEWSHLSTDKATEMCSLILNKLADFGICYLAGLMEIQNYPETIRLRGKNGHADLVHPLDDKWRELWTYYRAAAMLYPVEISTPPDPVVTPSPVNKPWWRTEIPLISPGFKVSKVYLDRESTKIRWFSKEFQWTTLAKDFVIYGPQGRSFLPIQSTGNHDKHPMLDIADIFVWNLARGFGKNPIAFVAVPTDVHTVLCAPHGKEIVLGG